MATRKRQRKTVLLITGMHRSGTSAFARVANLLGGTLPGTLLEANAANERGYWESPLFNRLNDEVLHLYGVGWRAWWPLPAGLQKQARTARVKAKALKLLKSEFGAAGLLVLKDPRICRLVPFWRAVIEDYGAQPLFLCPLRHPLEVAASLLRRNNIDPTLAGLLWLRYVLDAEIATRGMRRSFLSYAALLGAWRPVVQRVTHDLGVGWPRSPRQAAAQIDAFLSADVRHHAASAASFGESPELANWLRTTYTIVERWTRQGEKRADFAALDGVRRRLDQLPVLLHEQMEEARALRKQVMLDADEIEVRKAEASLQLARATQAENDRAEKARELAESTRQLDESARASAAELEQAKLQLEQAKLQLEQAKLQLEENARTSAVQLEQARAELAGVARKLADSDAELQKRLPQVKRLKLQLIESTRKLEETTRWLEQHQAEARGGDLQEARTLLFRTAASLLERETEAKRRLRHLTEELSLAGRQLSETSLERMERDAAASTAKRDLDDARKDLAHSAGEIARLEDDVETVKAQFTQAMESAQLLKRKLIKERDRQSVLEASLERSEREGEDARREAKALEVELRAIRSSPGWKAARLLNHPARVAGGVLRSLGLGPATPEKKAARLVAASRLFDGAWYLAQNPDVAGQGMDPALHYILHGAAEGRDPGPGFDTSWYLEQHKDVAAAGVNPLLHYLQYGEAEGRLILPSAIVNPAQRTPAAPAVPALPSEPPLEAAPALSFPVDPIADAPWVRQQDLAAKEGHLLLELGGVKLGHAPLAQGDRAGALAEWRHAIDAFAVLTGLSSLEDPRGIAGCRLVSFDAAVGPALADLWYANDRDMRFRFAARQEGGQVCVARFFQHELSAGGRLALLGEDLVDGRDRDFADIALVNALLPVLMTLSTPEGELLSVALLPFPSLCRGGVHYGELCASGARAGYREDLESLSRSLLEEKLAGAAAADFSVARVEVDLQEATGAERIFARDVREWLACAMQVRLGPADSAAAVPPRSRAHLEETLAGVPGALGQRAAESIASRERGGAIALVLPPDGVPTLGALVSRGLGLAEGSRRAVGSFVIAESATASPRWAVSVPPMGEELLDLQPAGSVIGYPVVSRLAAPSGDAPAKDLNGAPLAIRFRELRDPHAASLIMPVAPDASGPLLRGAARERVENAGATISVLLPACRPAKEAFAAFVESLKLQSVGADIEVLAVLEAGQAVAREAAQRVLQRHFPGRHTLLERDATHGRSARINHAAAQASGRFLLVAAAEIALHDPRTAATLRAIADHDRVASAGCLLLQAGANNPVRFRSAGIFPSGVVDSQAVAPTFSEPNCLAVLPAATYPVAANSAALFMVRADIWRALGGFDVAAPAQYGDLEYGVRAAGRGLVHLCTSAVSAELYDPDFDKPYAGVVLAAASAARRETGASAIVLRELKG